MVAEFFAFQTIRLRRAPRSPIGTPLGSVRRAPRGGERGALPRVGRVQLHHRDRPRGRRGTARPHLL